MEFVVPDSMLELYKNYCIMVIKKIIRSRHLMQTKFIIICRLLDRLSNA